MNLLLSLRRLDLDALDIPAFRAALILFTLLAAALLPLGVFAVLLLLAVLTRYVLHRRRRQPMDSLRATLRASLPDTAALSVSAVTAFYLHPLRDALLVAGRPAVATVSMLAGLLIFAGKWILLHTCATWMLSNAPRPMRRRPWSVTERLAIAVLAFSCVAALLALTVLPLDPADLARFLRVELWRV